MNSLAYIPASDGAANASLMTVTNVRSGGATTIQVNTVANAPAKFYGSMGTPHTFTDPITGETITVISEATAVDFAGHIDGSNVEIDGIAPGYTDNGSEVGDIIVIRPVTEWANNLFNFLSQIHDDDGTLKDDIVTTPKIADGSIPSSKLNIPWQTWTPTFTGFSTPPAGGTYEYCKVGNMCFIKWDMPNAGTSNSTAFTMTLPVAYTGTKPQTQLTGLVYNNDAYVFTAPGSCVINPGTPTILNLYRDFGGSLWTASNGKMIPSVTISYSCVA